MTDRLADWVALVDSLYPQSDAASWDATGLQVGAADDPINNVLVALDVTEATIAEAHAVGADLLLTHHPLLFRPLASLTEDTAAGRLALRAARARVAVLAAHTNFDASPDGTTDPIVRALGLRDVTPLAPLDAKSGQVKLVTFVPQASTSAVLDAVAAAGAGVIGEYEDCSFVVAGTGTFRPSAAANPVVGQREQRNEVGEDRLEVVVPRRRLGVVVHALQQAHPYEEVAFDIYPVEAPPTGKGTGRVGQLAPPRTLREVAQTLAADLPSPHLRVAGDLDRMIGRVAACGGAGDSLIDTAISAGADVYVTGDLRHHVTLDAMTSGLALIDAGHYATEAASLPRLLRALGDSASRRGLSARLLASAVVTEPWADFRPE